jgi:uncharacterized protein YgiM (DUF1202 family)
MNKRRSLCVLSLLLTSIFLFVSCDSLRQFSTNSPSENPPSSPTALARPSPLPTSTPDPAMVSAAANVDLKIYAAPSTTAQVVGQLSKGDKARVVGKTQASDWWQVVFLTGPNQRGWIASQAVTVSGPVNTIPTVKP